MDTSMASRRWLRLVLATGLVATLAGTGAALAAPAALAQTDDCTCVAPPPTEASISAETGAFEITTTAVSASEGAGFGGGTIYAPKSTECVYGGVVALPGLNQDETHIAWWGETIASHGFVVLIANGENKTEGPAQRVDDYKDALAYLIGSSPVAGRVDADSLAVMGHSFGAGAVLSLSEQDVPGLKAVIATGATGLTDPGSLDGYTKDKYPTLIIAAQYDELAPPALMGHRYYESIPDSTPKSYIELANTTHDVAISYHEMIGKAMVTWLGRFLDDDGRYDEFLWPVTDPDKVLARNLFVEPGTPAPTPEPCDEEPPTTTPAPQPSPEPQPAPQPGPAPAPGDGSGDGQVDEVPVGAPETGGGIR